LPTTWMFLGLAYWQLDQERQQKQARTFDRVDNPSGVGHNLREAL
jgi:hypothetical protein